MAGRCTLILTIAALGCVGCRETTYPDPAPVNPPQDKAVAPAQRDVQPPHWSARAPLFLDPFLLLPTRCNVMHVWAVEEQGQARLCVQWNAQAGLNANIFPDRSHFIQYDLATGKVVTDVLYKDLPAKPRPAKFLAFGGRASGTRRSWYGGKYVNTAVLCEVFADRLEPIPIGPEISAFGELRWARLAEEQLTMRQMDARDGAVTLVAVKEGKVIRAVKSPLAEVLTMSDGKIHIASTEDEGSVAFDDTGRAVWRDKELNRRMVSFQGDGPSDCFVATDYNTGRVELRRFADNSVISSTTVKGIEYSDVQSVDNVVAMCCVVENAPSRYHLLAFLDGKLVVREPCRDMMLLRSGKFPLVGDHFKVHSLRDGRVAKISGDPRFVIHGSVVSVGEDDDRVFVEPLNFK